MEQGRRASVITIDLGAVRANYRLLRSRAAGAACAAVLKADAYGLGASRIAPVLAAEGCRHFFVAHLDEALALRPSLPHTAELFVLHGPVPGTEREFVAQRLIPVLNSLDQLTGWAALAHQLERRLDAVLQVDTGMNRLGLSASELRTLLEQPSLLDGLNLRYLMSHLACAEDQEHAMNRYQLERFRQLRARFPGVPASFANSSGIFLGPDYHFDLARPGAALYGLGPVAGASNPMQQVVNLRAGLIQVREIAAGDCVGYGAHYRAQGRRRIATIAAGYADGWLRSLSGHGRAYIDGVAVPLLGRVSMDTCALDVTDIPAHRLQPGALVDLICAEQPVDAVAELAGTIGYEILTSLGQRYQRIYQDSRPERADEAVRLPPSSRQPAQPSHPPVIV